MRSHKLRSGLTVLGVVIGVLVVVVIASILTGLRKNIVTMIEDYGTNNIFAFHLSTGPQLGQRDRAEFRRRPLRPEDGEAIRERAPAVEDVAHTAFLWLPDRTLAYGAAKYKQASIEGVSANYPRIVNFALREGRFFTEDENDGTAQRDGHRASNVAEALFPYKTHGRGHRDHPGRTALPGGGSAREAPGRLPGRERGRQPRADPLPHRAQDGARRPASG